MARALVVLAPGFEEVEAVTPIDVLRRAGIEVVVAGLGGTLVEGSHGIALRADLEVAAAPEDLDLVVLPGGMPGARHLGESEAVRALVRRVWERGGRVAAICAAPALALGPTGLLAGRRVTCYPGFERHLPAGAAVVDGPVVVDGNLTTSRGPGTALDFALALAAQLTSPARAAELRRAMLAPAEPETR